MINVTQHLDPGFKFKAKKLTCDAGTFNVIKLNSNCESTITIIANDAELERLIDNLKQFMNTKNEG